jgi:hypothetical protein
MQPEGLSQFSPGLRTPSCQALMRLTLGYLVVPRWGSVDRNRLLDACIQSRETSTPDSIYPSPESRPAHAREGYFML